MGTARSADPEDTELASGKNVRDYRSLRQAGNTVAIARLIEQRFTERYFVPAVWSDNTHGFAILALSCLMLESLESFRRGLPDSNRQSEALFCAFFQREAEFAALRPVAHDFYKHVRCGILHQGETTGGWRVQQTGTLFDGTGGVRWLNGLEFALALKRSLDSYCASLQATPSNDQMWKHAFDKFKAVCKNCGVTNLKGL